jgi:hypothetical protein
VATAADRGPDELTRDGSAVLLDRDGVISANRADYVLS